MLLARADEVIKQDELLRRMSLEMARGGHGCDRGRCRQSLHGQFKGMRRDK
jgi:hypothetical protein